ncbi:MAG: DUF1194 domain-containing protein [Alphaproteobacteria bacterium]|nr:DUF1194 domain-containing protein [Alphaproteobacteria bacterium]
MAWIFLIIVAIVAQSGAVQVPKRTLVDSEMVLAVDVSGDGPNNNGVLVVKARTPASAMGMTVNRLPVINGRVSPSGWPQMDNLDWCYQDCVITGPASFIDVANDLLDFARAIRHKLILEIAGAVLVK